MSRLMLWGTYPITGTFKEPSLDWTNLRLPVWGISPRRAFIRYSSAPFGPIMAVSSAMNMEIYILQYYGTAYCDTEIFNFSAAKTAAFLTTGVLVKFFLNHKEPLPIL